MCWEEFSKSKHRTRCSANIEVDKRRILTRINSILISQQKALKTNKRKSTEGKKVEIQLSHLGTGKMDS